MNIACDLSAFYDFDGEGHGAGIGRAPQTVLRDEILIHGADELRFVAMPYGAPYAVSGKLSGL
jgi:hypothetical protein